MANSPATNGGISDAVGNSSPTNSENQREMPLRSAGDSSGVQHSAADNSSTHEEQHNGFAISPVPLASDVANAVGSDTIDWTFAWQRPILSEEDMALVNSISAGIEESSTSAASGPGPDMNSVAGRSSIPEEHNGLSQASHAQPNGNGNGAADSSTPDFYHWSNDQWANFYAEGHYPPENMLAASAASSSTTASASGSGVDNAPLDGASQQVGTVDAGSTTGLPASSPGENWNMHDPYVQSFVHDFMDDGSSTTTVGNGTIDPRLLMRGADDSADMTAEATPADTLAGAAKPAETMGAGSSTNSSNTVASPATLDGSEQQAEQVDVGNSVNNSGAPHAPLGGYVSPPTQTSASSSANSFVATQATPSGFNVQPQMPMGAGSSSSTTNNNFAAQQLSVAPATYNNFQGVQQQVNFAPNGYGQQQMGLNGSVQPFNPQVNAAPQAHGYPGAAQAALPNGGMGQYGQAPLWPADHGAVNAMAYQQPGGLNGGAQPNMGQNWQAPAPQPAMYGMGVVPVTAVRTRRRKGDAGGARKRRRTSAAPAGPAPTGPAATQAPAQQQVAAQEEVVVEEEGPYTHTAAGAPNINPNVIGSRQGQVPFWGQAFKHHNSRCDSFALNGCVPDCQVRAKWPQTWANWNSRRFRVQWKTAQGNRPQIDVVSGFAVHAERKNKSKARFDVLGEVLADGSLGKEKTVHRVEKAAAVEEPQSG